MPHASGETPEAGDYVKNKWEQPGAVTAVDAASGEHELESTRWHEGGVDYSLTTAAEFSLLSRRT